MKAGRQMIAIIKGTNVSGRAIPESDDVREDSAYESRARPAVASAAPSQSMLCTNWWKTGERLSGARRGRVKTAARMARKFMTGSM